MRDIVKLSADLQARVAEEIDSLVSERSTARAIFESRAAELAKLRDAELKRIEDWAAQQRALVKDIFGAILSENQADIERCDAALTRLGGEARPVALSRPPLKTTNKAAAAFAKAAE